MDDSEVVNLLSTWVKLNERLSDLSENDLKMMINYECSTKSRATFITRMHQRYSKLHTDRQRDMLLKGGLL